MQFNVMNLLLSKLIAENQGVGQDRALQLGLVSSMLPSMQGLLLTVVLAQREAGVVQRLQPSPPSNDNPGASLRPKPALRSPA